MLHNMYWCNIYYEFYELKLIMLYLYLTQKKCL